MGLAEGERQREGHDAGGHTGPIGTFSLVPQIVEVARSAGRAAGRDVPVLAAGGIGCGAQVAASLALGAQGAWLGTVWLGTREHELPAELAAKLIAAGSDDTLITRAHSGAGASSSPVSNRQMVQTFIGSSHPLFPGGRTGLGLFPGNFFSRHPSVPIR